MSTVYLLVQPSVRLQEAPFNTDAACGDLCDELRRVLDVIIGTDMCLATAGRIDEQYGVWLWFIVHVKPSRTIIAGLDARGT